MKKIIIIFFILLLYCILYSREWLPFSTIEWKECFDRCLDCMPSEYFDGKDNIEKIKKTETACVDYCRAELIRKRGGMELEKKEQKQ